MYPHWLLILAVTCLSAMGGGCSLLGKPDKANIELRKQNQKLQEQVADLQHKVDAQAARNRAEEDRAGTLPTLSTDRLAKLFTTHDIQLGRLTGGADIDPMKPGHEGLRIRVAPLDEAGDPIKAVGALTVEAFDLSRQQDPKIGSWTIGVAEIRKHWISVLNRYEYSLTLPWQTVPTGRELHLEVTFDDELTQRRFKRSVDVTIEPTADAGTPATAPTPQPGPAK